MLGFCPIMPKLGRIIFHRRTGKIPINAKKVRAYLENGHFLSQNAQNPQKLPQIPGTTRESLICLL